MCRGSDSDRTGRWESEVGGCDASPPPAAVSRACDVDAVAHGCGEIASDRDESSQWHSSLEQRLYRELWEESASEHDGGGHDGGQWGGRGGGASEGGDCGGRDCGGAGRSLTAVRNGDADELARILMADARRDGVEIDDEAVVCIAATAQRLWAGSCACQGLALMNAVLDLLTSRQMIAEWNAAEGMGPGDSFTLKPVSLDGVVRELAILGCGEVLFSSDEWACLRLLHGYRAPVPPAWMAEQLDCSLEWLLQRVEPYLLDLGLIGITTQGRVAKIPLRHADRQVLHASPEDKTGWENAPGEDPWSWGSVSQGDPADDPCGDPSDDSSGPAAGPSAGEASSQRPGASEASNVSTKRRDSSRRLPSIRSGCRMRLGKPVWGTPDSGRTGWTVVEQNWGLARPG